MKKISMKPTQSNHKKIKSLYFSCFLLILTLAVANIFLSGRTVTATTELKLQEQKYAQLQEEKEMLTSQLSQHISLKSLEEKALELGYVPITQTIAIKTPADSAVALR